MVVFKRKKSAEPSQVKETPDETTKPTLPLALCLAKTRDENRPGCTVLEHSIYVGKIAAALWERLAEDVRALLPRDVVVPLAALHDVGKISPNFQVIIWNAVAEEERAEEARRFWDANQSKAEGLRKTSHAEISRCVLAETALSDWAEAAGMHHGALHSSRCACAGSFHWQELRETAIAELMKIFGPTPTNVPKPTREQIELAAGFIVVADWLGSDENFLIDGETPDANEAEKRAVEILDEIGWTVPNAFDDKGFDELFNDGENAGQRFEPNETQRAFYDVATEPGVFIIEAPTGTGKTEAALWGAYRLLRNRCCNGIYFALPTRTTSDKIHERFEPFLARACADAPAVRLAHSTAWTRTKNENAASTLPNEGSASRLERAEYATEKELEKGSPDGKRFFADDDWFRPAKRALLQAFGVGTVDQALLSVLPQKHAFLRLLGLAGKVVIVDEAHCYDAYTSGLLDALIGKLAQAGATVIVLSATLTRKRREEFLALGAPASGAASNGVETAPENDPYPLISFRLRSGKTGRVAPSAPTSRTVKVERCERDLRDVAKRAVEAASRGELVLCVANTVDRARALYKLAKNEAQEGRLSAERIALLHGRFPTDRRETIENEQFAIFGKNGDRSSGALLVSTQVVEQSVDLDADFMIADLAPTDMLLQRIGRLWRHDRPNRKAREPRVLIVYPRENVEADGGSLFVTRLESDAYVYPPYVLWRTAEVWSELDEIVASADARRLLEATYKEREETEPEPAAMLREMEEKVENMRKLARSLASDDVLPTLANAELHTRYSDAPSVDALLLRRVDLGRIPPKITLLDGCNVKLDERWRFRDAVALARTTISCRKNARLDVWRPTCEEKDLTSNSFLVYLMLCKTYFKFSDSLIPFLVDPETGALSTLDGRETPFYYKDELGFYEESADAAQCCGNASCEDGEDSGECDEEFEW